MKTRIEEMVEEMFDTVYHTGEQPNLNKEWLRKALTEAHQAGYADGYERGKQARIEESEVEVRDSMCDYWYKKGRDEAGSLMYAQMEDWLYLREATDERTTVADVMNKLKALQDNK